MAQFKSITKQQGGMLECLAVLLVCAVSAVDTRTATVVGQDRQASTRNMAPTTVDMNLMLAQLSPDTIETGLLFPQSNTFQTSGISKQNKDVVSKDQMHTILDIDRLQNPLFASETAAEYRRAKTIKSSRRNRRRRLDRLQSATRLRRHHRRFEGLKTRSCEVVTTYRQMDEAEDKFGNVVKVMPFIHVEGVAVEQNFYESYCNIETCNCKGVDSQRYKSSCETSYAFAYARVIKHGEPGWHHIKIRSGCACVVTKTMSSEPFSILDLISS